MDEGMSASLLSRENAIADREGRTLYIVGVSPSFAALIALSVNTLLCVLPLYVKLMVAVYLALANSVPSGNVHLYVTLPDDTVSDDAMPFSLTPLEYVTPVRV